LGSLLLVASFAGCATDSASGPQVLPEDADLRVAQPEYFQGWVELPNGHILQATFENRDGLAILGGDMVFGPVDRIARTRSALGLSAGDTSGAAPGVVGIGGSRSAWPNGMVPYQIESGFSSTQIAEIVAGVDMVNASVAGVSLFPRTNQVPYLLISKPADPNLCNATVGVSASVTERINVGAYCFYGSGANYGGIVAHEILHVLGQLHEQSRCDRDSYITVDLGNIKPEYRSQFDRHCTTPGSPYFWHVVDYFEYDESSIMHYSANNPFVAVNPATPYITSLRGRANEMGSRSGLSDIDAYTINAVYQPYPPQSAVSSNSGGHSLISWSAYGRRSLGVSVDLIVAYEEFDDYSGTSTIYDHSSDGVGTTSGNSLHDFARPYTGTDECVLWSSINGSARYRYYYELKAFFGAGGPSQPRRIPAFVAPSSC